MAAIDFFDRGWRINPTGAAYIQDDREYSFKEVGELSCRVANALLALGFPKETKGAVWATNDVTARTCTLGLWRANMCWIPAGARNAVEENHYVLDTFDCEVLFFQKYFASVIAGLQPRLPKIRHWVCVDGDAPEIAGSVALQDWIKGQPATRPTVAVDMDDMVMLSSTGGTTGMPKGVMNTHRSLQTFGAHFTISCHYLAEEKIVNLAAAPMTHTTGILSLPATARGGTVVVVTKPDPALLLAAIPKYKVTEFFLPPTMIYRLLDIPDLKKKVDFSSLKYFMYGAAPMSIEKLKQAIEVIGPCMMGGYQSSAGLEMHTDGADHQIASGLSVFNRLADTHPDIARHLLETEFCIDWRNEEPPGEPPYHRGHIYQQVDIGLTSFALTSYLLSAQRHADVPRLSETDTSALETFQSVANDAELVFRFTPKPGDMMFLNNHFHVHARTSFTDSDDPKEKRHLRRLWLEAPEWAAHRPAVMSNVLHNATVNWRHPDTSVRM